MVRVGILGRYRTMGRSCCVALMLSSSCLLASCNSATLGTTPSADGAQLDVMDKVKSLDLLPRQSQPVNSVGVPQSSGGGSRAAIYEGAEVTAVSDERPQPS